MLGNIAPLAATATKSSGFNPSTLLIIVVVIAAFYMLMIRPQARRRQQAQQQQNSVQPGARVRTTAGMYATVVAVDGDDVILEVAPGIEVRYMKRAVMDVVAPAETVDEEEIPEEETTAGETDADFADHAPEPGVHDAEEISDSDTVPSSNGSKSAHDAEETAYEQATGTKKD
jgi:preprotein translocase subunit YajC